MQLSGLLQPGSRAFAGVLRSIMSNRSPSWGVVVNPGGTVGLPIYAEGVQALLDRAHTMPVGTRVRLGEPAVEPTQLLAAIVTETSGLPAIRALWRCWAQSGDEAPGLVLGVDLDPNEPGARAAAMAAIDRAWAAQHPGFTVDVAFWSDGRTFVDWMRDNVKPFHEKGR